MQSTPVIEANITKDAMSLYPNPASEGKFTILLPEISGKAVVRIYDNQGRMLYEKITQGGSKIAIDAGLKAGFYLVRIDSETSSFTKKLIVH
jgi:hypothetical protein